MPDALPSEQDLDAAISAHPRIELQEALIASRRAALQLEQSQAVQDVTIGGGVRFLRESSDAALVAEFSIRLSIPLAAFGSLLIALLFALSIALPVWDFWKV